jgi:4-hydroxy-tetrahydrodipicolinate synthase
MAPLSKTGILVYNAPGIGITLSRRCWNGWQRSRTWSASNRAISTPAIDQIANRLRGRLRLFCASDLASSGR